MFLRERRTGEIMHKQIYIDQLTSGMFLVGVDQSWFKTPFLFHKRLIRGEDDIDKLRQAGIRQVSIDPERGKDCASEVVSTQPVLPVAGSLQEPLQGSLQEPGVVSEEPPSRDLARPVMVEAAEQKPLTVEDGAPAPAQCRGPATLNALNNELANAQNVRKEALKTAQSVLDGVGTGARIDDVRIKAAVHGLMDSVWRCPESSLLLIQIRQFDAELFTHVVNVCVLSLIMGKGQELVSGLLQTLATGALLHDVGQMRLPRNIRRKTGLYTPQERKLMQKHSELGAAMLRSSGMSEDVCRVVIEHHERPDGSGYPYGLQNEAISTLSQIVGMTDTYDAMLQGNGGFPPLLSTQALRELYQMGSSGAFDATQVSLLIRFLGLYPVGALVELNTGERGVVIATNPADALKPMVKLVTDRTRQPLSEALIIDLVAENGDEPRTIRNVLDPTTENINIVGCLAEGC